MSEHLLPPAAAISTLVRIPMESMDRHRACSMCIGVSLFLKLRILSLSNVKYEYRKKRKVRVMLASKLTHEGDKNKSTTRG